MRRKKIQRKDKMADSLGPSWVEQGWPENIRPVTKPCDPIVSKYDEDGNERAKKEE